MPDGSARLNVVRAYEVRYRLLMLGPQPIGVAT